MIKDLRNASLMRVMTEYYEVLEPAAQTKVAGGSDGEQQCRLGLLRKAWGADGLILRQNAWSGWRGGREGEGLPRVEPAEAMLRWQNKLVCREEHPHVPGRSGGDVHDLEDIYG